MGHAGAVPAAHRSRRRRVGLQTRERSGVRATRLNAALAELAESAKPKISLRALRFAFCVFVFSSLFLVARSAAAQQTHLLVITGVPGDEEHAKKFEKWASSFIDAAKKHDAVPDDSITLLADRQATKSGVEKAFADIAGKVKPN